VIALLVLVSLLSPLSRVYRTRLASTSAKQRIGAAYLGGMWGTPPRERYLGKDVCVAPVEVERVGTGEERTKQDKPR